MDLINFLYKNKRRNNSTINTDYSSGDVYNLEPKMVDTDRVKNAKRKSHSFKLNNPNSNSSDLSAPKNAKNSKQRYKIKISTTHRPSKSTRTNMPSLRTSSIASLRSPSQTYRKKHPSEHISSIWLS